MATLKQGSSGPDVQDLQQKLKDLRFDPNGVDGNFGPGTKAAVIAFQQSKGLQADGVVGPATMAALQTAAADERERTKRRENFSRRSDEQHPTEPAVCSTGSHRGRTRRQGHGPNGPRDHQR